MKYHPWFENWRIGPEWTDHDSAFWSTGRITVTRGEYWFFLFNNLTEESRKVQVLFQKLGKKHWFNKKRIRHEHISDSSWRNNTLVWYYMGGELKELFSGMSTTTVGDHRLESEHPEGYRVVAWGDFPNYRLSIHRGDEELGHFELKGSPVPELVQAPHLEMRSREGFSESRDVFAKIDRVSQLPYCASNCCDFFTDFTGRFMGESLEGKVWVERARSFGLPGNWLLMYVDFDDRSRLWMRKFTGKIHHYDPLSYYFDDERTQRRFAFTTMDWSYYTGLGTGAHPSVGEDTEYVRMSGKGPEAESEILCEVRGQYLQRFTSYKYESRYYQLVLEPIEFTLKDKGGRTLTLDDYRRVSGYGEETYKKKWRETIFTDLDDRPK